MNSRIFLTCVIMLISNFLFGQEKEKAVGGNSIGYAIPQGALADVYDYGFGFYGSIDYNISDMFALRGDIGWYDFTGPEREYMNSSGDLVLDHPTRTVWEITGGAKLQVSVFYIEARAGYFSSFHSVGLVPAVGFRFGKFDIQGNYVFAGNNEYASIRLGYYWSSSKK